MFLTLEMLRNMGICKLMKDGTFISVPSKTEPTAIVFEQNEGNLEPKEKKKR